MVLNYPEGVRKIAEILNASGFKAYAVGGCMRDAIMGREPNDWDMTTDCSPEKMLEIFERAEVRTIPTGLKHGTVSVLINDEIYECTTFRIDGSYTDSRHPDSVTFTPNISEDLRRRDFTVNAMAGDPLSSDGEIVDIFGGREDIISKVIRAVGDPKKRFTEDALRILRAVRFATVLNFEIDEETKNAAKELGHRLSDISAERKSTELKKMLNSPYADRGISLLIDMELSDFIHPQINHPKVSLNSLPQRFSTRLAALFDSVPNLSSMKLSGEITKQVKLLCDEKFYNETTSKFTDIGATARYMISRYSDIAEDSALLRGNALLAEKISAEREKNPCTSVRSLAVNGNELLQVGIEAKKIGEIMSRLLLAVIESPELNNKESLINIAISQ